MRQVMYVLKREAPATKTMLAGFAMVCLLALPVMAERSTGGGDLVFKPADPNVRPVVFSHAAHVRKQKIQCDGCHYRIFQMAKGSYTMNMKKIAGGKFCGVCHNGRKAFDAMDQKNCQRCHV